MTALFRRILSQVGNRIVAGFLEGLRFSVGIVIGFVLGLTAIWVFMAQWVELSLVISKLVIFLLRLFLTFVL